MSSQAHNSPPAQKRSRIVINLERAREALHLSSPRHPRVGAATRRKRWPIVLAIVGGLLIVLAAIGFFYWRYFKTTPAYSLALVIDASQRNDSAAFDKVVDSERVLASFTPQVIDEAIGRLGTALTPAMRSRIEKLIPTLTPAFRNTVRNEVMRQVREAAKPAEGKPFFLLALGISRLAEIKQEGNIAQIFVKSGDRKIEMTMQRSENRWTLIAVKDEVLARRIADEVAKNLPAIGVDLIDDARKEIEKGLPNILEMLPGSGGDNRRR